MNRTTGRQIGSTVLTAALLVVALLMVACSSAPANGDEATGTSAAGSEATVSSQPTPVPPTTVVSQATATPAPFVGKLTVKPIRAPVGATATVNGTGFDPGASMDLMWNSVVGRWDIRGDYREEYWGRIFTPISSTIARVTADSSGAFSASFTVPDDFGFNHNITLEQGDLTLNRTGFATEPSVTMEPASGTPGTPITVTMKGIGPNALENSWTLMYDDRFVGFITSVGTNGTGIATIPAVGGEGTHVLKIQHGAYQYPYLNGEQNPRDDQPVWTGLFELTSGPPVLPLPAEQQGLPIVFASDEPPNGGSALWVDPVTGPIGTPYTLHGKGYAAGQQLDLQWFRVVGNRISGSGWDEQSTDLGTVTADSGGSFSLSLAALDDLGGPHRIEARSGDTILATTSFNITPSALPLVVQAPAEGLAYSGEGTGPAVVTTTAKAGDVATIHLKGVGWTETANIYTIDYDNGYLGYACGFNSQGDVTVFLPVTGSPGWHFIDLYPAIYKGEKEVKGTQNYRVPMLTYANDHPGEVLPAFHFAILVEP